MTLEQHYSAREVAESLGFNEDVVLRWCAQRKLRSRLIAGRRRIPASALDEFLRAATTAGQQGRARPAVSRPGA